MIDNDWLPCIKQEFTKPYYKELYTFVKHENYIVLLKMNTVKQ